MIISLLQPMHEDAFPQLPEIGILYNTPVSESAALPLALLILDQSQEGATIFTFPIERHLPTTATL